MFIESESLGLHLKAKMRYSFQCLLEEDSCNYQTQQLELYQAKKMLAMHMMLDHGRSEISDKCGILVAYANKSFIVLETTDKESGEISI